MGIVRAMSRPTPAQRRTTARVERLITLAAPGLDLLLAVGDRISRVADRKGIEWAPPRRALTSGPVQPPAAPADGADTPG